MTLAGLIWTVLLRFPNLQAAGGPSLRNTVRLSLNASHKVSQIHSRLCKTGSMPPRKRKPLGCKDTNAAADTAEPSKPDAAGKAQAQQIIDALDAQVRDECAELLRLADDAAVTLRNEYAIQLLKLPKKVRRLPLMEFQREYAGDIEAALLARVTGRLEVACGGDGAAEAPAEPAATVTRTMRRARAPPPHFDVAPATQTRRGAAALRVGETPAAAAAPGSRAAPGTLRMARPGEVLYSESGSPVELDQMTAARHLSLAKPLVGGTVLPTPMPGTVLPGAAGGVAGCATVITQRNPRGRTAATKQSRTILVTTEDGRQVVVTDGDLDAVPDDLRAEVREKLLDLYNTVASVVPAAAKKR